MYNNLKGGTVNMQIANYGRVRYQVSFLFDDAAKAAGQIDRFFYFTFHIRDDGRIFYLCPLYTSDVSYAPLFVNFCGALIFKKKK